MKENFDQQQERIALVCKSFAMVVVIVDWDKVRGIEKVIQESFRGIKRKHLLYVTHGIGTASSSILDMLGIGSEEKGVLFAIEPKKHIPKLKETLKKALHLEVPGNGILFSLPISDVYSPFKIEKKVDNMEDSNATHNHELIVTIVNQGYSDTLMAETKKVGAKGGTIVRARRIDTHEAIKLYGISVQLEKEILLIVAPKTIGKEIKEVIKPFCGIEADAKGIMYSLVASDLTGLNFE